MGYNIGIGEATISTDYKHRYIALEVERVVVDEAPVWETEGDSVDLVGKANYACPSYQQMDYFCSVTGLKEFFFNTLIDKKNIPGQVPITQDDLITIKLAKERWIEGHPGSVPGWREGEDSTLARLIWYEFWFDWALENCRNPIIHFD
ncbi:hypothetical protein D1872_78960 [compost metagenome]|uniref:hypothetical protein n=1 Tax=Paenibacillus polymyxa TaxID=1406 RepID=UPI000F94BFD4